MNLRISGINFLANEIYRVVARAEWGFTIDLRSQNKQWAHDEIRAG